MHSTIIHQIVDGLNTRAMEKVAGLFKDGFIRHDLSGAITGIEGPTGVVNLVQKMLAAFPDMKIEVHDILKDADKAAARMTLAGTHQGEFLGTPATGKKVLFSNINIYRFEDNKVAELWQLMDLAGLMKQIGKYDT